MYKISDANKMFWVTVYELRRLTAMITEPTHLPLMSNFIIHKDPEEDDLKEAECRLNPLGAESI